LGAGLDARRNSVMAVPLKASTAPAPSHEIRERLVTGLTGTSSEHSIVI
jgi:hypothetical protein